MGGFSIWHLLIVVLIFGIPAIAVATERSEARIARKQYIAWIAGIIAVEIVLGVIAEAIGRKGGASPALGGIGMLIRLGLVFFLYRLFVQRCRDAGIGKWLAYVAIIPVVNLAVMVFLMFKPTAPATVGPEGAAAPDTGTVD